MRHRLVVVLAAAICAVAAGAQSYVAIAEGVADLPEEVAVMLGLGERCPCGSTIRRLVQRLYGDRFDALTSVVTPSRAPGCSAVPGKTGRAARR